MNWEIKRMDECCSFISDGDHLPPPKAENGISFITITNINPINNSVDFSSAMFVPPSYYEALGDARKAKKNDILYSVVGSFGIPVLLTEDKKFVFQRHIALVRPDCKVVLPEFLYYTMKSHAFYSQADSYAIGSAQRTLSLGSLRKMKVKVPPLKIQESIASLLRYYDSLIDTNNKRIKVLEQMGESMYKEWFVRFRFPGHETAEYENGIPKGWRYEKLFDVAKITYGYPFSSDTFCDDESLNAVVRIRDIPNNATKTYTPEHCDTKYLISQNAILVGMDGIFHMCLWNGARAFLNQRVVEIESTLKNVCNYLLFLSIAPQVKFWEQTIAGTTVAHLGDKHLKKIMVLLPDAKLLERANSILKNIMIEKNELFKKNENLKMQRDFLLPRLMSGKLEV